MHDSNLEYDIIKACDQIWNVMNDPAMTQESRRLARVSYTALAAARESLLGPGRKQKKEELVEFSKSFLRYATSC